MILFQKEFEEEFDEAKVTKNRIMKALIKPLNKNLKKTKLAFLMLFCGEPILS